ncbi:hypothetical protein ACVWW7_007197 [Bradyrhizobium sp. LM6.9]
MGQSLDEGSRIGGAIIVSGGLAEICEAGAEQGRKAGIVERPGRKLAHALVLPGEAAQRDLQDPQVEASCAQRRSAIRQVGVAGGEAAIGDREVAATHAAEPAAAAELLIDADAVTGRVGDV